MQLMNAQKINATTIEFLFVLYNLFSFLFEICLYLGNVIWICAICNVLCSVADQVIIVILKNQDQYLYIVYSMFIHLVYGGSWQIILRPK